MVIPAALTKWFYWILAPTDWMIKWTVYHSNKQKGIDYGLWFSS
jgi:hypothetical protein